MTTKIRKTTTWTFAAVLAVGSLTACGEPINQDNNDNSLPAIATNSGTNGDIGANGNTNKGGNTTGGNTTGGNPNSGNKGEEPDPNSAVLPDPADFMYSSEHTFQMGDLLGGFDGLRAEDDMSLICTSGCEDRLLEDGSVTLFPVDSGFGWDAIDFVGAALRPRDGDHEEGWIGPIEDDDGNHQGIAVSNVPSLKFKAGPRKGQWCAGLGGEMVKCKSDHYVTMEHVLTCDETIPYHYYDYVTGEPTISDYENCVPLDNELDRDPSTLTPYAYDLVNMVSSSDYSMINGETPGEYKYIWGNWDKRPSDLRLLARVPLPDEWKEDGRVFEVTEAKLAIVHTISNNPNDKISPEDIDNEGAAGRLPSYEVDADGRWVSTRDCYEGDGDFIPAGTVLKNPDFAIPDAYTDGLKDGYTNAWYTTLDRDPFADGENSGPRWRLTAPKFGQDLPGVEIPVEPCTPMPLKKEQVKYERGKLTTTLIDLLDPLEPGGESPFSTSTQWLQPNEEFQNIVGDGITSEGVTLTEDLDLSLHIKGDKNPVRLYKAVLYLDYQEVTDAPR